MFKIDKDIPFPNRPSGRQMKYPWLLMEIGDSFYVPDKRINMRTQSLRANKAYAPKEFVTIVDGDGHRIWRVR